MVVLGILLALAAAAVGAGVVIEGSSPASISLFGQHVPVVHTQGQVFAAGVLVAFFFLLGLAITVMTTGRALRRRRELRDLREEHQESLTTLEMEKQRLQQELARARQAGPDALPGVPRAGMDASSGVPTAGLRPSPAPSAGTTPNRAPVGDRPTVNDVRVAPRQMPNRDAMSSFFDRSSR